MTEKNSDCRMQIIEGTHYLLRRQAVNGVVSEECLCKNMYKHVFTMFPDSKKKMYVLQVMDEESGLWKSFIFYKDFTKEEAKKILKEYKVYLKKYGKKEKGEEKDV